MVHHSSYYVNFNQNLHSIVKPSIKVTSWPIEKTPIDNTQELPLDDVFTVFLAYHKDDGLVDDIHGSFELKRDDTFLNWVDVIKGWLDNKIEFDVEAWQCIVDVVLDSVETMLEEVRVSNRKSLDMFVKVEAFRVEEEEEEEEEEDEPDFIDDDYYAAANDDDNDNYDDELMDLEYDHDIEAVPEPMDSYDDLDRFMIFDDDDEPEPVPEPEPEPEPMFVEGEEFERCKMYVKFDLKESGVVFAKGNSGVISMEDCSICLEEFGKSDNIARLPCSHIYHENCMVRWVAQGKRTCPLCRFNMAV